MVLTKAPAKLAMADAARGVKFPTVYLTQGIFQKRHHGLKAGGE